MHCKQRKRHVICTSHASQSSCKPTNQPLTLNLKPAGDKKNNTHSHIVSVTTRDIAFLPAPLACLPNRQCRSPGDPPIKPHILLSRNHNDIHIHRRPCPCPHPHILQTSHPQFRKNGLLVVHPSMPMLLLLQVHYHLYNHNLLMNLSPTRQDQTITQTNLINNKQPHLPIALFVQTLPPLLHGIIATLACNRYIETVHFIR